MKRLLLVMVTLGCGKSDSPSPAPQPAPPIKPALIDASPPPVDADDTAARAAAEKAKADATAARSARKKFEAKAVLGQTKAGAAKALGVRGEQGPDGVSYQIGDEESGVLVRVEFDENGKAGKFTLTGHEFVKTTDARDDLLAVAGATVDTVAWGIDEGDLGVVVWNEDARKRANERERVAGLIGQYLSNISVGSGHARGELDTVFLVRTRGAKCDRALLTKFKRDLKPELDVDVAKLGFVTLQCDLDGPAISAR